jgi:hypothetical protein
MFAATLSVTRFPVLATFASDTNRKNTLTAPNEQRDSKTNEHARSLGISYFK